MIVHPYFKRPASHTLAGYIKRQHRMAAHTHHMRAAPSIGWTLPVLCNAYNWPAGTATGRGIIALVELAGGWLITDVIAAFIAMQLPPPLITDISVDGLTANNPGSDSDAEVALDIQVAAGSYAMATGLAAIIRVYWGSDIAVCVARAHADGCDVCSISWGADEAAWGPAALQAMEAAAEAATADGMVVLAASGDNDSSDGGIGRANVDAPACCPHVIGCGGSTFRGPARETVWNDNSDTLDGTGSGGGFSTYFPAQSWQVGSPVSPPGLGRMVPDIAANADPETGYNIIQNNRVEVLAGTSAVAPLYAGLIAAAGTKLGFITPLLFDNQHVFNDIVEGDNGAYKALAGPDACTGLGSPVATLLLDLFAPKIV